MTTRRVLIADDDAPLVNLMKFRCRSLGLVVQTAHNAMIALTLIHKDPPDLILLDISMPGGNGLAVCEMLATDRRLSKIPVIILTGKSDEETVGRCRASKAHYMWKSMDVWDRLKPMICGLLAIQPTEPTGLGRA
jgi:CheY-like chemotaxis protein